MLESDGDALLDGKLISAGSAPSDDGASPGGAASPGGDALPGGNLSATASRRPMFALRPAPCPLRKRDARRATPSGGNLKPCGARRQRRGRPQSPKLSVSGTAVGRECAAGPLRHMRMSILSVPTWRSRPGQHLHIQCAGLHGEPHATGSWVYGAISSITPFVAAKTKALSAPPSPSIRRIADSNTGAREESSARRVGARTLRAQRDTRRI